MNSNFDGLTGVLGGQRGRNKNSVCRRKSVNEEWILDTQRLARLDSDSTSHKSRTRFELRGTQANDSILRTAVDSGNDYDPNLSIVRRRSSSRPQTHAVINHCRRRHAGSEALPPAAETRGARHAEINVNT